MSTSLIQHLAREPQDRSSAGAAAPGYGALTEAEAESLIGALAVQRGRAGFSEREITTLLDWGHEARIAAAALEGVLVGALGVDVREDGEVVLLAAGRRQ